MRVTTLLCGLLMPLQVASTPIVRCLVGAEVPDVGNGIDIDCGHVKRALGNPFQPGYYVIRTSNRTTCTFCGPHSHMHDRSTLSLTTPQTAKFTQSRKRRRRCLPKSYEQQPSPALCVAKLHETRCRYDPEGRCSKKHCCYKRLGGDEEIVFRRKHVPSAKTKLNHTWAKWPLTKGGLATLPVYTLMAVVDLSGLAHSGNLVQLVLMGGTPGNLHLDLHVEDQRMELHVSYQSKGMDFRRLRIPRRLHNKTVVLRIRRLNLRTHKVSIHGSGAGGEVHVADDVLLHPVRLRAPSEMRYDSRLQMIDVIAPKKPQGFVNCYDGDGQNCKKCTGSSYTEVFDTRHMNRTGECAPEGGRAEICTTTNGDLCYRDLNHTSDSGQAITNTEVDTDYAHDAKNVTTLAIVICCVVFALTLLGCLVFMSRNCISEVDENPHGISIVVTRPDRGISSDDDWYRRGSDWSNEQRLSVSVSRGRGLSGSRSQQHSIYETSPVAAALHPPQLRVGVSVSQREHADRYGSPSTSSASESDSDAPRTMLNVIDSISKDPTHSSMDTLSQLPSDDDTISSASEVYDDDGASSHTMSLVSSRSRPAESSRTGYKYDEESTIWEPTCTDGGSASVPSPRLPAVSSNVRRNSEKRLSLVSLRSSVWSCCININELIIGDTIGRGCYGTVYRAKWEGMTVALKRFEKRELSEEYIQELQNEIDVANHLGSNPRVVKLYGYCDSPSFSLVLQYCANGNVSQYVRKHKDLSLQRRLRLALGAAYGIRYLHSRGIIHRDIAARNLMLDDKFEVLVGDFGMSRLKDPHQKQTTLSMVGPLKWMSPEALMERAYSPQADCYSFGITLWEILTGEEQPYPGVNKLAAITQVCRDGLRPRLDPSWPVEVCNLMERCWHEQAALRPPMDAVVSELESLLKQLQSLDGVGPAAV